MAGLPGEGAEGLLQKPCAHCLAERGEGGRPEPQQAGLLGPRSGFYLRFIVKHRRFPARARQEPTGTQGQSCCHPPSRITDAKASPRAVPSETEPVG